MKKRTITSLIAVFAFIATSVSAQQKYTLKVKPEEGKKIAQQVAMTMDIETQGQQIATDLTMGYDMINTAKKEDTYLFEIKYTGINMKMNSAGLEMAYDSKNPEANEFAKQMHATVGKLLENNVRLSIDQYGKSTDITLPEGVNLPFDKSMFENISTVLPEQPVGIGESWTSKTESDESGMLAESKLTLVEVNDQGYKVNVEGKMFGPDAKQAGSIQGFYILDKQTCLTKITELTSDIDMTEVKIKTVLKCQ
ncbi:DUF6263 family protein [Sphingobacterium thalpophilum]|uniref:DUF6263 family protein n=1 Tax=Sphingobacterium thalpophilum TaxID=259 RepID=UPI002D798DAD|nr:DUF6263 family protein [Sphingobacterium thalpophilum]